MVQTPVYLDNHATTPVDPRVVEAMLPFFTRQFGNAGSSSHTLGRSSHLAVEEARQEIAHTLGAHPREIVFTSGATEANNLALRGLVERRSQGGPAHIVSVQTEHKAVLDPLTRLQRQGVEVTLLPVAPQSSSDAGRVSLEQLDEAIRPHTLLVSIMLANNEIGVLQPLAEIGALCRQRGVALHTDATQAVGKIPVNVQQLHLDLMSFSAHKFYGPKGIGALFVRHSGGPVRLASQIVGGGQERGLRSGTLNVPGIVAMGVALRLCRDELPIETVRLNQLRCRLFDRLSQTIDGVQLNGPPLTPPQVRLAGNLNCSFAGVDGEAIMLRAPDIAVSSGSACTSASPDPSHVLRALGLHPDRVRSSLRFGLGRFTTLDEIDFAVDTLAQSVHSLRALA